MLDLGRPGGGVARITTEEEYAGWRAALLTEHDLFRAVALATFQPGVQGTVSDPVVSEGLEVFRQIVQRPSAGDFVHWVTVGGTRGLHGGTYRAAQVDATLIRYRAMIDDLEGRLPGRARVDLQHRVRH